MIEPSLDLGLRRSYPVKMNEDSEISSSEMNICSRSIADTKNIIPAVDNRSSAVKVPACAAGICLYSSPSSRQRTVVNSTSILKNCDSGSTAHNVPTP